MSCKNKQILLIFSSVFWLFSAFYHQILRNEVFRKELSGCIFVKQIPAPVNALPAVFTCFSNWIKVGKLLQTSTVLHFLKSINPLFSIYIFQYQLSIFVKPRNRSPETTIRIFPIVYSINTVHQFQEIRL